VVEPCLACVRPHVPAPAPQNKRIPPPRGKKTIANSGSKLGEYIMYLLQYIIYTSSCHIYMLIFFLKLSLIIKECNNSNFEKSNKHFSLNQA
jgi:hypothetical protein